MTYHSISGVYLYDLATQMTQENPNLVISIRIDHDERLS
jgi:hypothetical protein